MPRKLDFLWEFGEPDGGFERLNLTYKLCGHHMTGEVYKLKFHLAQIRGHGIGPCINTNPEIIRRAIKSLEEIETMKVTKATLKSQMAGGGVAGLRGDREGGIGSSSASASTLNP